MCLNCGLLEGRDDVSFPVKAPVLRTVSGIYYANWYYFYGRCSMNFWWINKWSPSSSSYLKHHVLHHMKTIMSNTPDILTPNLSLFPPLSSALHWILFVSPCDASDVLNPNRKEHTHPFPPTHYPPNAADSTREAIKRSQIEQTSHWLSHASLNDLWIVFSFYCFV